MQSKVTLVAVALSWLISAPSQAQDTWQNIVAQGRSAEVQNNPKLAVLHFEKALTLLPAAALEQKVKIESSLINAYRELGQIDKASAHCQAMLSTLKTLQSTKSLSPDAIFAVFQVVEAPEHPLPSNLSEVARNQANLTIQLESLQLCQLANPEFITSKRLHNLARAYVRTGDLPKALHWLHQSQQQKNLKDDDRRRLKLEEAILLARSGQAKALNSLPKSPTLESDHEVIRAAIFAQDYKLAKTTLDARYKQVVKSKNKNDEYQLLDDYIQYFQDRHDKQGMEAYLRRQIALLQLPQSDLKDKGIRLPNKLDELAQLLKAQNKTAEALQALNQANTIKINRRKKAKNLGEREFFISEQDRAELAKAKAGAKVNPAK